MIGGTRFYERAEIKDALAYLTLLVNPPDTVAFGRIVNSPRRGIGETSQARLVGLRQHARRAGLGRGRRARGGAGPGAAAVKAVGRFMSMMERLRERAEGGAGWATCCGDARGDRLHRGAGGRAHDRGPGPAGEPRGAGGRGARVRRDAPRSRSVEEFLQQIALFSEQDNLRDEQGLVTLMTLHNAKGLEFDTVFIIGLEDGVFPHSRAIESGDLEEERRLATSASRAPSASST